MKNKKITCIIFINFLLIKNGEEKKIKPFLCQDEEKLLFALFLRING